MSDRRLFRSLVPLALVGLVLAPAYAEDVEGKFRLGVTVGFFNTTDAIDSDAANILILRDRTQDVVEYFLDPRDDSSVFGDLNVQSGPLATLHAQYAVNKIFMVEASIGYYKGDLGDIEVQAQFDNVEVLENEAFNFTTFRVPAGEIERVPIQISGLARFRPRASFNPYIGGGIGYSLIGFDSDPALDLLSQRMDSSVGAFAEVTGAFFGNPRLITTGTPEDLDGAMVSAEDTFEWHLAGGAEYSFKRRWAAYFDVRWTHASRSVEIGFNGSDSLGVSVPQLTDFIDSEAGLLARAGGYGAVDIRFGGLFDGGQDIVVPQDGAPQGTDCDGWMFGDPIPDITPINCTLLFCDPSSPRPECSGVGPDGELDTGLHYVQGGKVDLDGLSASVGVRYTF